MADVSYTKIVWEDSPSTNTPINASNLNKMDEGIYDCAQQINQINSDLIKTESVITSGFKTGFSGEIRVLENNAVTTISVGLETTNALSASSWVDVYSSNDLPTVGYSGIFVIMATDGSVGRAQLYYKNSTIPTIRVRIGAGANSQIFTTIVV